MRPEIYYSEGDGNKPLVIFVHGLGMNASMWTDPVNARILGGKYPLSHLLGDVELKTSFHDLNCLGYPVLAWSQMRPAGPAMIAVEELREVVNGFSGRSNAGIVLIGHSRGGLIARSFLQDYKTAKVKGIVTIASPHKGSSLAKWVVYVSPLAAALKKIMDIGDKDLKGAVHRIAAFLSGAGVREMLPGSGFLKALTDKIEDVRVISIGGTDPSLLKISGKGLPEILAGIISARMLPDEMKEGIGDGFVSAESSVYPGGDEHRNYNCNHAGLIFDTEVREYILRFVGALKC